MAAAEEAATLLTMGLAERTKAIALKPPTARCALLAALSPMQCIEALDAMALDLRER